MGTHQRSACPRMCQPRKPGEMPQKPRDMLAAPARLGDSEPMRAMFACFSVGVLGIGMAACPAPKMPTGPSPEYEDPPAPSWLDGGSSAHEGGAPPATTLPGSEHTPPPPAS